MSKHNELGKEGEILAQIFLQNLGYKILHLNYRVGHKEIDIIAQYDKIIVFVEVKYRSSKQYGMPEDFVSMQKKQHIKAAAQVFMDKIQNLTPCRFDVISILHLPQQEPEICHFIDAFY